MKISLFTKIAVYENTFIGDIPEPKPEPKKCNCFGSGSATLLWGTLGWLAETPEFWIINFQLDSIFSYNFGHTIKLSANIHDLSANMTKVVCKYRI